MGDATENKKKRPNEVQIELDEKTAAGNYANFAIVTHSPAEFIIDFTQLMPGIPKARVRTRVIMAPLNVKALAKALMDNISKYEKRFGEIQISEDDWKKQFGFHVPPEDLPN